jgi:hypothetical protein
MSVSTARASAERLSESVCHSKKDTLRFGSRRRGAKALARAGRADRPKAARFCGRMRNPYFHDSPLRASSQRPASIRQHPHKTGAREHNPTCKPLLRGHRGGDDRGGFSTTQKVFEAYVEKVLASTL